ncbi:MAG: hypothetical protein IRZ28_06950 [Steroidobacteraceae bacterium]|nr:hypothetical protein [Steroidobacteraceae bacterium]
MHRLFHPWRAAFFRWKRDFTEHVTQDRARRRIGLPITSEYEAIGSLYAKARTSYVQRRFIS